ncbi:hypothetical protein Arnit_2330 [Arcobacter nitrofigilis DSM 7299]|uniref:Uncharacterized protein n=1 Tax=Arcobacter nitrofigilis (strain ATCC 33309 / DSM 7299 / CCUG 15893 / LMG 7604 / NCTC 12251 / CI) TaxID=572480 RepID=D5V119_ARCNC|nr:hypothetical protein [Arcobacter nitrofigilis]ADG93981.1 hypothetical protein Arnit_2330 [Arcobacter nitrofigilis DSM 7299]
MNLPHQAPIRFAQEILERDKNFYIVKCSFPYIPTLSMISEAAAQSSAAFAQDEKEPRIGFLISLKNIKKLSELDKEEYQIKISKSFNFGAMTEYKFELFDEKETYAEGELTIALKN